MIADEVSRELVSHSADKIGYLLNPDNEKDQQLIKSGLQLYRSGSVYNIKADEEMLYATVQDFAPYKVELNLDFFELSECACPTPGICEHQLGAFFAVYVNFDSPGALVEDWRQTPTEEKEHKNLIFKTKSNPHNAAELPFNEYDPEEWVAFFNQEYVRFLDKHQAGASFNRSPHDMLGYIYHSYYAGLVQFQPNDPFRKSLYLIMAGITGFMKLVSFTGANFYSESQYAHALPYIEKIRGELDGLIGTAGNLINNSTSGEHEDSLAKSLPHIENLLTFDPAFAADRLWFYRSIMSTLYQDLQWLNRIDLEMLPRIKENVLKSSGTFGHPFTVEYNIAIAHFAYMSGNDDIAFDVVSGLKAAAVDYTFYWIKLSQENGEWSRSKRWLDLAAKKTAALFEIENPEGSTERTTVLLDFYKKYAEQSNEEASYGHALRRLLPYSYSHYSDYLEGINDYRRWVELQIIMGYNASDFKKGQIKQIEENAPQMLLPLFHQSITALINKKSRPAYEKAAAELEHLQSIYKKLERTGKWEAYISRLTEQTARLRAFQQELKRGNLLHD
ncbi:hypothetical protein [Bacillus marinisedimentorum]|uniref:hypothetical protein n=1 Tax=Bacillus marinisedimentorum TaxID=1821260 RepID=UPI0007DF359E|nr:hypothetical protein [Bacillus marinisedimentorum]